MHIDLHIVMPTEERPAITVVTSGMSERPMRSPAGDLYAELMLVLPPTWPTPDDPDFESPSGYWPYRLLKELARLPHEYDTLLWTGHTVPNGDPPQPYGPNTKLCGALIAPMLIAPEAPTRSSTATARSSSSPSGRCTPTRCSSSSTRASIASANWPTRPT